MPVRCHLEHLCAFPPRPCAPSRSFACAPSRHRYAAKHLGYHFINMGTSEGAQRHPQGCQTHCWDYSAEPQAPCNPTEKPESVYMYWQPSPQAGDLVAPNDGVVCHCTHLTSFAALQEEFIRTLLCSNVGVLLRC